MTAQSVSNTKQPADAVQVAQATDMDVATYEPTLECQINVPICIFIS